MDKCGIYAIVNKINGKCYIGSSVDINKRWAQHKCTLRTNNHKNKHLQNAWNKYGENNFFFKIIFFCEQNDLFLYEQKFLDINVGGYNIGEDATCPARGLKKTEAHKKKLSESQIGNKRPQEIIDKIRKTATGKKQSPETKQKIKKWWNDYWIKREIIKKPNKSDLEKLYLEKTQKEIAVLYHCSESTIKNFLKEYGLRKQIV